MLKGQPGQLVRSRSPRQGWKPRRRIKVSPTGRIDFYDTVAGDIRDNELGIIIAVVHEGTSAYDALYVVFPRSSGWVWDDAVEPVLVEK